jgi:hypothetical protein
MKHGKRKEKGESRWDEKFGAEYILPRMHVCEK